MNKNLVLLLCVSIIVFETSCEKTKTPFTANAIQPSQGFIKAQVLTGSKQTSNATVEAVDPSGNHFSTITDSSGFAFFNPVPFVYGDWTINLPSQANRCLDSNAVLTMTKNAATQSVTFQYGITITLTVNTFSVFPAPSGNPYGTYTGVAAISLAVTNNDCGSTWNATIGNNYATLQNWSGIWGGNYADIPSGSSQNFNFVGSSGAGFIYYFNPGQSPQFYCRLSSSTFGSGSNQYFINSGPSNVSWVF